MRKKIKRVMQGFLVLVLIVTASVTAVGYSEYKKVTEAMPIQAKIQDIQQSEAYVAYEDIAPLFVKAMIATEDARFPYRDSPLDMIAIMRAIRSNFRNRHLVEGGSTIPQQLAKNLYFDHSASFTRKVSEYLIAKEIMQNYDKEEVFALYASIIYFGDGHNGIRQASLGYFDVEPSHLNAFQATLLAGLPQAPSIYQLSTNYKGAIKRQYHVLQRLVDENYLSQQEADIIVESGGRE